MSVRDLTRWSLLLLLGMAVLSSGCGYPQYGVVPSKAENGISFERSGLSDVKVDARVGADTKADIQGLDFKTSNGSTGHVDKVTFEATPSNSLTAQVAAMQVYDSQLKSYYTGLADVATANWTGFANSISAAAPIAAPFLSGLAQAKLAKAQRPGLIDQLSGLVLSGKTSTQAMQEIDVPPDILAEVDRRVDLRLQEIKAQLATTQPSK